MNTRPPNVQPPPYVSLLNSVEINGYSLSRDPASKKLALTVFIHPCAHKCTLGRCTMGDYITRTLSPHVRMEAPNIGPVKLDLTGVRNLCQGMVAMIIVVVDLCRDHGLPQPEIIVDPGQDAIRNSVLLLFANTSAEGTKQENFPLAVEPKTAA